jgi:hypothetical protein
MERIHHYRRAGSVLIMAAVLALVVSLWGSGFGSLWRIVGTIAGVAAVWVAFAVGELLGSVVAQRGLKEDEVTILHALRFLEHEPDGATLRFMHERRPDLTRSWVESLATDRPRDVHVERAARGASLLGIPV